MKDLTKEQLTETRPDSDAMYLIDLCLDALFGDQVHTCMEGVCPKTLTYEELIGTLLNAKDRINELIQLNQDLVNDVKTSLTNLMEDLKGE